MCRVWGGLQLNSVVEAEARAVLFTLEAAKDEGIQKIILNMEYLILFKALNGIFTNFTDKKPGRCNTSYRFES